MQPVIDFSCVGGIFSAKHSHTREGTNSYRLLDACANIRVKKNRTFTYIHTYIHTDR